MTHADLPDYIRQHGCKSLFDAMLSRFGVADLIDTFAGQIEHDPHVPGGPNIARDLRQVTELLPSCAWRNP